MWAHVVCTAVTTFLLCWRLTGAMAVDSLPKNYLVFGGNGMMGSAVVERLLSLGGGSDSDNDSGSDTDTIVVVNRGNWYWDTGFTVKPFVRHMSCDRLGQLSNCPDLIEWVTRVPYIDAVLDFSAYHPDSVSQALNLMQGKVKLYVYISTDSVYEVCSKTHSDLTREEDAVRPSDPEAREELSQHDHYGNRKFECEEVLAQHRKEKNGPPYLVLRLPDVIGPRDNTHRWWIYQVWMKLDGFLEKSVSVPASIANTSLSFVYVNDIADTVVSLLQNTPEQALDQAFNLAIAETPTLLEVLKEMKTNLNLTDMEIVTDDKSESIRLYPSVQNGAVNISKAKRVLGWAPTDWSVVVMETVRFYESAMKNEYFRDVRNTVIKSLQTHFTSKPYDVIRGLKKVYGLHFPEPKDEL